MQTTNLQTIENTDYARATLLAEAIGVYCAPETLQAYDHSFKVIKPNYLENMGKRKEQTLPSLVTLSEAGMVVSEMTDGQLVILHELHAQILALVKVGDLIPVGFAMPRASTDKAVILLDDACLKGEVNWSKSEVVFQGTEFSAVRLLEKENQKIRTNKFTRAGNLVIEKTTIENENFTAMGDSQFLAEKEAAKFLKISPRVIQGYRVKGGGPEWTKLGQAVRYKMSDLKAWAEKQKP